jgi:hypothetical protein
MANGVIESMSMSTFVAGALSLELPHICMTFFPIPPPPFFFFFLSLSLLYLKVPFVSSH